MMKFNKKTPEYFCFMTNKKKIIIIIFLFALLIFKIPTMPFGSFQDEFEQEFLKDLNCNNVLNARFIWVM